MIGASAETTTRVSLEVARLDPAFDGNGRVVGVLAPAEDRAACVMALLRAADRVLSGEVDLLTHADLTQAPGHVRADQRAAKRAALAQRRLKRYVFRLATAAGPRIIKIAEVTGSANGVAGLFGDSVAAREHRYQVRCQRLGLAATSSLGFLEWRRGPFLRRSCQVQTVLPEDEPILDSFLAEEVRRFGAAAYESLARAIAKMHAAPFFHADLKGFHAIVRNPQRAADRPAEYDLAWIDLARVSFRVSARKRIINLYQALRFVLPNDTAAQERFVTAYCRATGWHAREPQRALERVQRFLAHKLRTHPCP